MTFSGMWHIQEMELWDEEYFNMEVQAFINIKPNFNGDFQFGLVSGDLSGKIAKVDGQKRLKFTFEGFDEGEHCSGSGWIALKETDLIVGEFCFYNGDNTGFLAKRAG